MYMDFMTTYGYLSKLRRTLVLTAHLQNEVKTENIKKNWIFVVGGQYHLRLLFLEKPPKGRKEQKVERVERLLDESLNNPTKLSAPANNKRFW